MSPEPTSGCRELVERIVARIRSNGPISFAEFMDLALHDPEHGYYAAGARRLGRSGDFYTASDVGPAFGACIARQLAEMDDVLGRPARFHAVEFGSGRGWLAADVLDHARSRLPTLADRLGYVAVDRSPGMRQATLRATRNVVVEAPEVATARGVDRTGCVLAVELFDALPVHRVRRREGRLLEIRVGAKDTPSGPELVEIECAPTEPLRREAERRGAAPRDGFEAEVCTELGPQLETLATAIDRGFLLVIDYGHDSAELYGAAHARGTLLAYDRHRAHEDYLARVGEQDLTAHVDLGELVEQARRAGWTAVGRTTQDRFLIANGILEAFETSLGADEHDPARVKARLQAMQLIHPTGMGRTFHVLAFARGIGSVPSLQGFVDPFAR